MSTNTPTQGLRLGSRSPALSALAAAVGRSPLLSSRSPPLRANAPEFLPSDFTLTATGTIDEEPKQASRANRTASSGHADVTALTKALVSQCHYYFSDHNISKDKWMRDELAKDDGWVAVSVLCDMPRIRQLTNDPAMLICALRQSDKLEMSGDGLRTRRSGNNPIVGNGGGGLGPNGHNKGRSMDAKRSVYVDRLPAGHNGKTVRELFSRFGRVDHVVAVAHAGGEGVVLETPQGTVYSLSAGETLRGVFIEFEKQGAAKKCVSQISHFNKMLKQSKTKTNTPPSSNTTTTAITSPTHRKSSNATNDGPSSPTSSSPSLSPSSSSSPADVLTTSSSGTTTVTMAAFVAPTSPLGIASSIGRVSSPLSLPSSPTSSASVPPPIQLPLPRVPSTASSSPTSSPSSPSSPLSSPDLSSNASSIPSVTLEAKDSDGGGGTKKEDLPDTFIGMKVMSRYAYDKKFGHLSPAMSPLVGVAGIPIFGLAGGSPLLLASPPQHVAHIANGSQVHQSPSLSLSTISNVGVSSSSTAIASASGNNSKDAAAAAKKASRVQIRDRSNWRIDASPGDQNEPTSSPSSSPPGNGHNTRGARASSFEDSELIAAFMDDGTNNGNHASSSSPSPSPPPPGASRGSGTSASVAAKRGKQKGKSGDFSHAAAASLSNTSNNTQMTKKESHDVSQELLPASRRPLQLVQRTNMKATGGGGPGVMRIALGPDPDNNRGFAGRGRGRGKVVS